MAVSQRSRTACFGGVDEAPAESQRWVPVGQTAPKRTKYKIFVGSFGLDSVHLTGGSSLDTCYEVWE
jgi:hypothetical protein